MQNVPPSSLHAHAFPKMLRIPAIDHTVAKSLCALIHSFCSPLCAGLLSLGSRMQELFSWNGLELHIDFCAGKFFVLGPRHVFFSPKIPDFAIFYCLDWLAGWL